MRHDIVSEIVFSVEREKWPTKEFTAEAHLVDGSPEVWSMRAELWTPPNENGKSFAWVSFLSPNAPYMDLPLCNSFDLSIGRAVIATARLRVWPTEAMLREWKEHMDERGNA